MTQPTSNGIATFNDLYVHGGTVTDGGLIATAGGDLVTSAPFQVKSGGDHPCDSAWVVAIFSAEGRYLGYSPERLA
jgi:hypothetical protein